MATKRRRACTTLRTCQVFHQKPWAGGCPFSEGPSGGGPDRTDMTILPGSVRIPCVGRERTADNWQPCLTTAVNPRPSALGLWCSGRAPPPGTEFGRGRVEQHASDHFFSPYLAFSSLTLARVLSGSALACFVQPLQHRKTGWSLMRILTGTPIE